MEEEEGLPLKSCLMEMYRREKERRENGRGYSVLPTYTLNYIPFKPLPYILYHWLFT